MVQVGIYGLRKERGAHSKGCTTCGRRRGGGVGGREVEITGVLVEIFRDM